MRTAIKVFRQNIGTASDEDKTTGLNQMYSLIDGQASKGLMPKSRAARLKSRLAAAVAK